MKKFIKKLIYRVMILAILALISVAGMFIYRVYKGEDIEHIISGNILDVFKFKSSIDELGNAYKMLKVVDGDTLLIDYNGKEEYVRMIGIDTPESVNPDESKNSEEGIIASQYTKSIITDYVYLEFDIQQRDKYDRLLAYVYLPDGTFLNEKIIRDGYAYTMNVLPNVKHQITFIDAFNKAREEQVGLWGLGGE